MIEKRLVRLTAEERGEQTALAGKNKASAAKIRLEQNLRKADTDEPHWMDSRIVGAFSTTHLNPIARTGTRLASQRVETALNRQPQARLSQTPKRPG